MHLYINKKEQFPDTHFFRIMLSCLKTFAPCIKSFCHLLLDSTSRGSAQSAASLQTPGLEDGVPTEAEEGAEANRSLQGPAITRVRWDELYCHKATEILLSEGATSNKQCTCNTRTKTVKLQDKNSVHRSGCRACFNLFRVVITGGIKGFFSTSRTL